jgi:ribose/xylose/arabinose/galactoside ABC-type transport system permease subunit
VRRRPRLVNAGLIRGLKIPSIIATLATLSILDGISLTMRPTAQGVINDRADLGAHGDRRTDPRRVHRRRRRGGLADLWLHASGSGLRAAAVGLRRRVGQARRGRGPLGSGSGRLVLSAVLAAVAAFFVMARSPIGNATIGVHLRAQQHHRGRPGGASLAGGRATFLGSTVAALLLALILTVLPFLGCHPTTAR